ncbi:MAG: DUF177 domain-containing protein [Sphingobacteriaceae bacterium]|nr:DUF177 domain-containing protein [Sphingobacteriaceae bacterium]MBP7807648.1 DUF177 domain-containing protein [Bacteroidia bacterium]
MGKKQYIVKFAGLPVGSHEFEFDINGTFFEQFDDCEITKANLQVVVVLLKQNNLMQLQFDINGTVNLDCDRCLIAYDFPIEASENLVVRFGNPEESTDEIMVINEGEGQADVSHYLFEYITLALPYRRVPCEIDEDFECDEDTLKKLNESSVDEEKETNPMWEKLNKLKINKN